MTNSKIFIIGLPRTATTSICVAMLGMGFKVAHTCYTAECLANADVIADTPAYSDYQLLDKLYPGSKFIHLQRELELWIPSIKQLLQRMHTNVTRGDGGFNPHIKRCFVETFSPFTLENISSDDFLTQCYQTHQKNVEQYFQGREDVLLSIDVSKNDSYQRLADFVQAEKADGQFKRINVGGKVRAWKDITNSLKVESTKNGRIDKTIYPK
ncbi:MAG: sulfotransferase [Thalassotalea sp.]|nr:sulfotransferase [Thalassotalea sp.]MDG2392913.1 sulfotransferase [Thalassotalea sp.]